MLLLLLFYKRCYLIIVLVVGVYFFPLQVDYDNLVHDQQEKLLAYERKLDDMQRECFEKVDSAAELAEKQNALTMTLEAKVRTKFHFLPFLYF
jgi:hypothetical protein